MRILSRASERKIQKTNFRNTSLWPRHIDLPLLSPFSWAVYIYRVGSSEKDLRAEACFLLSLSVDIVAGVNYLWTLFAG